MSHITATQTARETIQNVAREHGVLQVELTDSHKRTEQLIAARIDLWKRLRARRWSYDNIGRHTGFSHSTVMSGLGARRKGVRQVSITLTTRDHMLIERQAEAEGLSVPACIRGLVLSGLATKSKASAPAARIIKLHQAGEFDTIDISRIVGIPEADVCNTISVWREMRRSA